MQTVLQVLFDEKIDIHHQHDGQVRLDGEHETAVYALTDPVIGGVVRHISRTFGIPLAKFYYPNNQIH